MLVLLPELNFFRHVKIDEFSATPKYLQLSNSILKAIESGKILKDEVLPSINELSYEYEIARATAEKAYKYLKSIGVLGSVPGKSYYIKSIQFTPVLNILLLFNKLSAHKKIIYDSFVEAIGENVSIDFYIYNNNYNLFKKLLINKIDNYSHYVIIPHFTDGGENANEIINTIPKEKLILLDKKLAGINGEHAAVYENFREDIYGALVKLKKSLEKYSTIKIIFPENSYFPYDIIKGYQDFCQDYAFNYSIVSDITTECLSEGEVYITVMEDDLITLVEKIMDLQLVIGSQIGIISYNETPMKKIIFNGITTISTDFQKMGKITADLILENSKAQLHVPFQVNIRNSL